ncbi:transcriptional repressor NrdR [Candidatus Woesearchaeota archaeon]|nr:transcriptional repressor NrdR [Candidatus Woesearchaeota archaeon]
MRCPYCLHEETKVLDSRVTPEQDSVRRRRECEDCSKRFTTYERIEVNNISVVKKDGRREPFDREKLLRGMLKACEKRPVKREHIEEIVDQIQAHLLKLDQHEIKSKKIGELIMDSLKDLDDVAYVRFASVYRRFKDANQFTNTVNMLQKMKNR